MNHSPRAQPLPRHRFASLQTLGTRWMDNDVYGHVNIVVHDSLFDTAVSRTLIDAGVLDIHGSAVIGLVVQTQCHYFESIAFPQTMHAGLRVEHLVASGVRCELGLLADNAPLAAPLRQALIPLQLPSPEAETP